MNTIYHLSVEGIDGLALDFKTFEGKKILIVNVASACGYTPQYQQLQELYTANEGKLAIIGCPCNDFGGQESGDNAEIATFCESKYKITFPMTAKLKIKDPAHPLYTWLTSKDHNGSVDAEVKWNFHKFLIDERGHLTAHFPSAVSPLDDQILDHLN